MATESAPNTVSNNDSVVISLEVVSASDVVNQLDWIDIELSDLAETKYGVLETGVNNTLVNDEVAREYRNIRVWLIKYAGGKPTTLVVKFDMFSHWGSVGNNTGLRYALFDDVEDYGSHLTGRLLFGAYCKRWYRNVGHEIEVADFEFQATKMKFECVVDNFTKCPER